MSALCAWAAWSSRESSRSAWQPACARAWLTSSITCAVGLTCGTVAVTEVVTGAWPVDAAGTDDWRLDAVVGVLLGVALVLDVDGLADPEVVLVGVSAIG